MEARAQPTTILEELGIQPEAEAIRYSVNQYGYRIDGRFYRRVSTHLRGIPKFWLPRWKINMAAKRLIEEGWEDGALPVIIESDNPEKALANWLDKASDEYRDERADRGSAIHAALEELLTGAPIPKWTDEEMYDCAISVRRYMGARKIQPIAVELTLFSRSQEFAGTTDLWYRIADLLGLGDWKTGKDVHPEAAIQVAGFYRNAEYALIDKVAVPGKSDTWDGTVIRWRPEYAREVVVNHVTPDGVREFPVPPQTQHNGESLDLYRYLWNVGRASAYVKEFLRRTDSFRKDPELEVFAKPNEYPREAKPKKEEEAVA